MDYWYKNAVIYTIDMDKFQDSDNDGAGDFRGLTSRLSYLSSLGVTCVRLLPFQASPSRDNGYDIEDFYRVNPRYGTLRDFIGFVHKAGEHGIRVVIDLAVNHTSDTHPWFEAARQDPTSRFRNYFIWSPAPPDSRPGEEPAFPGEEETVWTYDELAKEYYYHRFYRYEPQLNHADAEVTGEILKIMDFWRSFGVAGFRAVAPAFWSGAAPGDPTPRHDLDHLLFDMREYVRVRRNETLLITDYDAPPGEPPPRPPANDEAGMYVNAPLPAYLFLSLARSDASPLKYLLGSLPTLPPGGQWVNFMRDLDELDLAKLAPEERAEVMDRFAADERMRIYGRGIRRRIAPMIGDPAPLQMAYSLLFSLPGSPSITYGDEIGMADDLTLDGKQPVRLPMRWDDIDKNPFLAWMRQLIRARLDSPEIGCGSAMTLYAGNRHVLAHRIDRRDGSIIFLHNLSNKAHTVHINRGEAPPGELRRVFGMAPFNGDRSIGRLTVELEPYGYLWLREKRAA